MRRELEAKQAQVDALETENKLGRTRLAQAQGLAQVLQQQLAATTGSLHEAIEAAGALMRRQRVEEWEEEELEEDEKEGEGER